MQILISKNIIIKTQKIYIYIVGLDYNLLSNMMKIYIKYYLRKNIYFFFSI